MPLSQRFWWFRSSYPAAKRKQESCLDQIPDEIHNTSQYDRKQRRRHSVFCEKQPASNGYRKQITGHISNGSNNNTSSGGGSSSRNSLLEEGRPRNGSTSKLLAFFQKGFHKSKSVTRLDSTQTHNQSNSNNQNQPITKQMSHVNYENMEPIDIQETAIQMSTGVLFHKANKCDGITSRPKPLISLQHHEYHNVVRISSVHPSLTLSRHPFCVKVVCCTSSGSHSNHLRLPSGRSSLGRTCTIFADSSQASNDWWNYDDKNEEMYVEETKTIPSTAGYLFSCSSESERRKWISVLTRVAKPNLQNLRRKHVSLNLWIQEAKNIPSKKRYFCEVYLDGILAARTTTKLMGDMLFWGEEFNMNDLNEVETVTVTLWRGHLDENSQLSSIHSHSTNGINSKTSFNNTSKKKKGHQPVMYGQVSITSSQLMNSQSNTDKWYPIATTNNNDSQPMIRMRMKYQLLNVLPLADYTPLLNLLQHQALPLLLELEPLLPKVRCKQDLASLFVSIAHKQGKATNLLCDLIMNEINKADDTNLILRGNSMASKAMEVYLKLIGEKYLHLTLDDFVSRVLSSEEDCEVDPTKVPSQALISPSSSSFTTYSSNRGSTKSNPPTQISISSPSNPYDSSNSNGSSCLPSSPQVITLTQRQESLQMHVEMVWAKIISSSIFFPKELRQVFSTLRQRITTNSKFNSTTNSSLPDEPDLCDRIISSCIFLRYLCPAILSPSLFGLVTEYPDENRIIRTFTLVAKCIQTLANFTNLNGAKEPYMTFMNEFIESNMSNMHKFLRNISLQHHQEMPLSNVAGESEHQQSYDDYVYWDNLASNVLPDHCIDLNLSLSMLHQQLNEILAASSKAGDDLEKSDNATQLSPSMMKLRRIIENLNNRILDNTDDTDGIGDNEADVEAEVTPTPSFYTQKDKKELVESEWKQVLSLVSKQNTASGTANINVNTPRSSGYSTMVMSSQPPQHQQHTQKHYKHQPPSTTKHHLSNSQESLSSCSSSTLIEHYSPNNMQINNTSSNKYYRASVKKCKQASTAATNHNSQTRLSLESAPKEIHPNLKLLPLTTSLSMPSFQQLSLVNDSPIIGQVPVPINSQNCNTLNSSNAHSNKDHQSNNEVKNIRDSLIELRRSLDMRVRQLLLADRRTCELELERINLLRRMCEVSPSKSTKEMDGVYQYLDTAQSLLSDYIYSSSPQDSVLTEDHGDRLMRVLDTNQRLQSALLQRIEQEAASQITAGYKPYTRRKASHSNFVEVVDTV